MNRKSILTILLVFAAWSSVHAVTITQQFDFSGVNLVIPESPVGIADHQTVSSSITSISEVQVQLTISGSFNGDLYVYLSNDANLAVLLNRSGKTAENPFGYADSGFDITFSDLEPTARDVHGYQAITTPISGMPLTGIWQPDARSTTFSVTDSSTRDAFLSGFNGSDPSTTWTLFAADLSSGAVHTLNDWSLIITGDAPAAVPEPGTLLPLSIILLLLVSRRARSSKRLTERSQ